MFDNIIGIMISLIVIMIILLNYKKIKNKICNINKLLIFILAVVLFLVEITIKLIWGYQTLISIIIISVISPIYLLSFIYLILSKIKS